MAGAENDVLRMQVAELTQAKMLMQQYRELLNIPAEPQFDFAGARGGRSISPFVKTLIANGGANIGIEAGMAVMGTNGLIGQVTSVGAVSAYPAGDSFAAIFRWLRWPAMCRRFLSGEMTRRRFCILPPKRR